MCNTQIKLKFICHNFLFNRNKLLFMTKLVFLFSNLQILQIEIQFVKLLNPKKICKSSGSELQNEYEFACRINYPATVLVAKRLTRLKWLVWDFVSMRNFSRRK